MESISVNFEIDCKELMYHTDVHKLLSLTSERKLL